MKKLNWSRCWDRQTQLRSQVTAGCLSVNHSNVTFCGNVDDRYKDGGQRALLSLLVGLERHIKLPARCLSTHNKRENTVNVIVSECCINNICIKQAYLSAPMLIRVLKTYNKWAISLRLILGSGLSI